MSSVGSGILTDVLSKLSSTLGATFREIPDLFNLHKESTRALENGYSAILTEANNDNNKSISYTTLKRQLIIKISYRTFTRPDGNRTKTVLTTLYNNEETIINKFLLYPSKPTGLIGVIDPVETTVETLTNDEDDFLINTIKFNVVYRFLLA